jgi:N-acetylglucosamine kinase-like BadF-type ATPase
MNEFRYVLGLDAGGSKTSAVLCAMDSSICAEAQGGPANLHVEGAERCAGIILDLVQTCCHSVGCSVSEIGAIVAGVAGAGRSADRQNLTEVLSRGAASRNLVLNKLSIESDARIALEGAFGGKPGIVVIAGTGSIVFGRDMRGNIVRSGGWGRIVGDDGSGYEIGRAAIRFLATALDGHAKPTKLSEMLRTKYGFVSQEAVIDTIYKNKFDIASVAPSVLDAAHKGDKAAKTILAAASASLVVKIGQMLAVMNKGKRNPPKRFLALTGSLLASENVYSRSVRAEIKRTIPAVVLHPPESSPVFGAALMALALVKS